MYNGASQPTTGISRLTRLYLHPTLSGCVVSLCEQVIADITKRMGAGMAEFIPKEVNTTAEYNKYELLA